MNKRTLSILISVLIILAFTSLSGCTIYDYESLEERTFIGKIISIEHKEDWWVTPRGYDGDLYKITFDDGMVLKNCGDDNILVIDRNQTIKIIFYNPTTTMDYWLIKSYEYINEE